MRCMACDERRIHESTGILQSLTTRQHLYPHESLARTLERICRQQGFPAYAASSAIQAIGLPAFAAVGRLSRDQITRLAQQLQHHAQPLTPRQLSPTF